MDFKMTLAAILRSDLETLKMGDITIARFKGGIWLFIRKNKLAFYQDDTKLYSTSDSTDIRLVVEVIALKRLEARVLRKAKAKR